VDIFKLYKVSIDKLGWIAPAISGEGYRSGNGVLLRDGNS